MLPDVDTEPHHPNRARPRAIALRVRDVWIEDMTVGHETRIGSEDGKRMNPWISGASIAAALAADYLLFRFAFHTNYFHWYIVYGGAFALALTVFSVAVELDDEPNLVAADPSDYVGAWFFFFGISFFWLRGVVTARPENHAEMFDPVITAPFAVVWMVAVFAWLLIITPALYFITFVCGAPIRQTRSTTSEVLIQVIPRDQGAGRTLNVGLNVKKKPVSATNAIAAAVLFGLSFLL